MDGPNAGTWVARLEHLSGFSVLHRRSLRPVLFSLFLYALSLAGAMYFLVTPEESVIRGGRWFHASLALWSTATMLSTGGYSLCVDTFGHPRERWGRLLRKVAALGAIPAGALMLAAIGYMVFGTAGVVVGGISALLLQAASLLYGRAPTPVDDEPGGPDLRDDNPT
jgi:hypothetical protein